MNAIATSSLSQFIPGSGPSYEDTLGEIVRNDPRFIVMTAENRAAIRNLPALLGPRFLDVGICEQTMIGAAAGLALRGRVPIVHALATFLTMRAFEFIRTDVGIGKLPVKMVGSFAGFLSEANGPTHQALEDVGLLRGIPGVNVWCPADAEDMRLGLAQVLYADEPYYIRYNNRTALYPHQPFMPGKAEVIAQGGDVTILTYGTLFNECYQAAELLRSDGYEVGLINIRTLKPLDVSCILDTVRRTERLVVVEDHFKIGGLYSAIAELLLDHGRSANIVSCAFDGRWFKPALLPDTLAHEGFSADALRVRIREALHERSYR